MPGSWRTVRVFISSTFRDMHAERDHLIKVVFPALREGLAKDRIHLIDVDLRWGVTREQAEHDLTLNLCLRQIDECRPFFIGILGERYGWVPRTYAADAVSAFGWIQHHTGKSITELEMLFGVLDQPDMHGRAFFYLRDPAFIADLPEAQRRIYLEFPSDEEIQALGARDAEVAALGRRAQLNALKDRIRGFMTSTFVYDNYPCRWDPSAANRYANTRGRVAGLELFGESIRTSLELAIRSSPELRDHYTLLRTPRHDPNGLIEEREQHERFMESRLQVYVGRDNIQARLVAIVEDPESTLCLVSGPSGSGKSAVLARLARSLHDEPEVTVISHFVGASDGSTSLRAMLRRFCLELGLAADPEEAVPGGVRELAEAFRRLVASIPSPQRIVFIIDGLNQLDDREGAHSLYWLPITLPSHVKFVVSCITEGGEDNAVIRALERRSVRTIVIDDLTPEDQVRIIRDVPALAAKTLDEGQVRLLLSNSATRNPLFLLVALEELRGFGSFEELDARIRALPRGDNAVTAIFAQVIERLRREFNPRTTDQALSLLGCARHGLSESELRRLVEGGVDRESTSDLFPILRQIRPYLIRRGELLDFAHRGFFKAVRGSLLTSYLDERPTRLQLADYFGESAPMERRLEEWPWQLMRGGYWELLYEALHSSYFLALLWVHDRFALREYWAQLQANSRYRVVETYSDVCTAPSEHEREVVAVLAELMEAFGYRRAALPLCEDVVVRERREGDTPLLASALVQLGFVKKTLGDNEGATTCFEESVRINELCGERRGYASALGELGSMFLADGNLEKARELHEKSRQVFNALGDAAGLQAATGNLASILKVQGQWREALKLHEEEESLCREAGEWDGEQRSIANQAVIYSELKNFAHSRTLFEKAIRVCRQYGNMHGLQRSLGNLAGLCRDVGDLEKARELNAEQERLCRILQNPRELCMCLDIKADLLNLDGKLQGSLAAQQERETCARESGLLGEVIQALVGQATLQLILGNSEESLQLMEKAATVES